jgi:hypothetical protein
MVEKGGEGIPSLAAFCKDVGTCGEYYYGTHASREPTSPLLQTTAEGLRQAAHKVVGRIDH